MSNVHGQLFFGTDTADIGDYIRALAAGMFLYISLVSLMSKLGRSNKYKDQSPHDTVSESGSESDEPQARPLIVEYILNNLGIWTGVALLFVLAKYEDKINFGDGPGHHH